MASKQSNCSGCGLLTRLNNFILSPIYGVGSVQDWVMFAGIILVASYLWFRVNRDITDLL
jgi:hypothetical protein